MAGLDAGLNAGQTDRLVPRRPPAPIRASSQFAAVAWLRWRLFINGFRRKGGTGEVIARVLLYPVAFAFLMVPILGAGLGAWFAISNDKLGSIPILFWAIFALQMVVSINIAPPTLSFDPELLIRFPLSFSRYLVLRLVLGLLSASTIAGTLSLLSAALGLSIARSGLAPVAFAAAFLLALANLLLIRTVFAWVDRWLSTRRAREAMTGVIVAASVGLQYLNMTFNTGRRGVDPMAKLAVVRHLYHFGEPVFARLPPGLAASAVQAGALGQTGSELASLSGILLFAMLFLAIFAWRMRREYRGENLSEALVSPASVSLAPTQVMRSRSSLPVAASRSFGLSPAIAACWAKELLYLRRNVTQFYALLVPLAMVFIIAGRFGALAHSGLVLPCAIAYSFLSIAALAYNIFGLDATGIQTYLLAPVPLRTVVLAKNLLMFLIVSIQFVLLFSVISYLYGVPPLVLTVATLFWLLTATFLNTTVGNQRSLTTPKKMDPSKLSRRQASPLSAYLALGLVLTLAGAGAGLYTLGRVLHLSWLPVPVLAASAAASWWAYQTGLSRIDALAEKHRETLIEELCKAS